MKVLRSEGVAYHTGPESCVAGREASGEALTGVPCRLAIEPRKGGLFGAPTPLSWRKARRSGAQMRVPERPRVVGDPSMGVRSLYGNRAISRLSAE